MKGKGLTQNKLHTMEFVSLDKFDMDDSVTSVFNLDYLTQTIKLLKLLDDMGFDEVTVRMKQDCPLMIHIGDETVFAVCPLSNKDED